ncbi:MAG: glycosyltransferase [Flavobacteriaceae bacterium]
MFTVFTHVAHNIDNNQTSAYAPYVREMNIWFKHVDDVMVYGCIDHNKSSRIIESYVSSNQKFKSLDSFDLLSVKEIIKSFWSVTYNLIQIWRGMKNSDHIHLRCPGNIGLLACIVQIFFPSKKKTAKYAGNWDPSSEQPWSYRLQKWILSNTLLTRNIKVLVYGDWENQTKNIVPFFTASYPRELTFLNVEKPSNSSEINFIFVGALVHGKQPHKAIDVFAQLNEVFDHSKMNFYGEGPLLDSLIKYSLDLGLSDKIIFNGGVNQETLIEAYQKSHYLLFMSKSEGWPKVVAEAMFWSCIPVSTSVSCVPFMLGNGERGVLANEVDTAVTQIINIEKSKKREEIGKKANEWSRQYTLDKFELEIQKLLD